MNVHFAEWVLDRGRRELLRAGQPVALTSKAMQLLDLLLEKRPNVVSKAEIYERLWPSTFVAEVNLSRLVFELRRALLDDSSGPHWIRTVRGFGYAFSGPATEDGPPARAVAREVARCRLILRDREVTLSEGENVLGRSHEAAVWLESTGISRRHARIVVAGERATLEDLGSKNGTFWRDNRVSAITVLADGDAIRVGPVSMTFRVISPEESTETNT
jgi:DNA-binding winged helix-turn-helix (wHTH) protein